MALSEIILVKHFARFESLISKDEILLVFYTFVFVFLISFP